MRITGILQSFLLLVGTLTLNAQTFSTPHGERVDFDMALSRAMKTSSLTDGGRPFHAVLAIGEKGTAYSGNLEVWWQNAKQYKMVLASPSFRQTRVVNGSQVMEINDGDYYPRWLQNFVDGVLNPIPMIENFRGRPGTDMLAEQMRSCINRDDRPGGITDQLTWGMVCFTGSEPRLESVLTMNYSITFKDWQQFGTQKIARTYETSVLDYKPVVSRMTTLEEFADASGAMFSINTPTPPDQQMRTEFVSTLKEESLIENAPKIEWPAVREGKTEGYMIVYARTDSKGQVRETAKHNSDQPGLESFGMDQALRYKFKPLLVNGAPVQMEMPLVLHFVSKLDDPLPTLRGEELMKQISGCSVKLLNSVPSGVRVTPTHISVNEQGKLTGEGYGPKVDPGSPAVVVYDTLRLCRFAPYKRNGVVTYYHGDLYSPGLSMIRR